MMKQIDVGSPVLSKDQECPGWLAFTYVGLEIPGANNHTYIVQLTFPLIMGP